MVMVVDGLQDLWIICGLRTMNDASLVMSQSKGWTDENLCDVSQISKRSDARIDLEIKNTKNLRTF
jgi:hypothetical protein